MQEDEVPSVLGAGYLAVSGVGRAFQGVGWNDKNCQSGSLKVSYWEQRASGSGD